MFIQGCYYVYDLFVIYTFCSMSAVKKEYIY